MSYEAWREEQWKHSQAVYGIYKELARQSSGDALARKDLVKNLWEDDRYMGLALAGPNGCGKHTTVAYLLDRIARIAKSEGKCTFLFLEGRRMMEEASGSAELCDYLNQFLDDCYDGKGYRYNGSDWVKAEAGEPLALCIVIEEPEQWDGWKEVIPFLQRTAWEYCGAEELPRLFMVFLSEVPISFPSLFCDLLYSYGITLPTRTQRARLIEASSNGMEWPIPAERIVDLTEGMTCRRLRDTLEGAKRLREYLDEEELKEFFQAQALPLSPEQRRIRFEERIPQLIEDALCRMETIVASQPQVAPQTALAMQPTFNKEDIAELTEDQERKLVTNERDRLENMAPKDLLLEVMGAERHQEILQHCEQGVHGGNE